MNQNVVAEWVAQITGRVSVASEDLAAHLPHLGNDLESSSMSGELSGHLAQALEPVEPSITFVRELRVQLMTAPFDAAVPGVPASDTADHRLLIGIAVGSVVSAAALVVYVRHARIAFQRPAA